ncbi:MAG TPA: RNA methyltransferase substrate-binding domain-containing protein, partial [Anaerovoracaceae bacterium]|nr:RNA methyltransferase substrate-binding domain-containing protein [Anaerovoracaceae bacterium]
MIIINSNKNKNFKLCSQLAQKKFRDKLGLYLIEGPNLLEEAVNSDADIKLVVFNEKMLPDVEILGKASFYKGAEVIGMSEKLFEKLAQTEASQGVIGVIKKNCETQEEV